MRNSSSGPSRRRCRRAVPALLALSVAALTAAGSALAVPQGQTARSPHGEITIPCQNCHTTDGWKPIRAELEFDHAQTRFRLEGLHRAVGCRKCHESLRFSDAGMQCADCHADIHRRQFGSNCETCHTARGWQVSRESAANHENRFPLAGAHAAVGCEGCHRSAAVGVFRGLSTDCAACHLNDYRNARTVDHGAAGFSTACEACHGVDGWAGGFDHVRASGFALTGTHAGLTCVSCHAGQKFAGTPATCVSCHLAQYTGAGNPNHVTSGFPQDCAVCHGTAGWTPASFDHNRTRFQLTGAHASVPCGNCHLNGVFAGTPSDCYSCHSGEYGASTNPNHGAAGFPRDCTLCHSTSKWSGATFNHTRFPIYSGAHNGKWTTCLDCHTNSNNYAVFSCITCHEHAKTTADQQHREVANYVYNSANCYACHPTGRGD